ncbi:uncharacterized protein G2W53_024779 [Senna tora]|uniref:Plant viral-response family protein n=1 Tax=Senna tora TaxID=362788 RepID=A0A834TDF7_9FABA|nr:uncharacterized protein G2W53_024779 [Senna tora]
MAALLYHLFSSSALVSLGLYNLISSTCSYLKSPHSYSAKPFHPFSSHHHRLRHLPLYLIIVFLLLALFHQLFISSDPDPLLKGGTSVHRFTSLQSAAVLFLFFILSLSLLLSDSSSLLPLPTDLIFALASALFFLQYSVSASAASVQTSGLEAKCDAVSARISAIAALLCLVLACKPRLFVADVGLGASIFLQGLWVLQTGLSLYVDAFIPEGCHRLLDVVNGVEGSTKCDVEEFKFRAVAILDLMFLVHVMVVVVVVMITYVFVGKSVGIKRSSSYEALPNASSSHENNLSHIQMKSLTGTQA